MASSNNNNHYERYWREFHNQEIAFEEYKKIRQDMKNVVVFAFQKPPSSSSSPSSSLPKKKKGKGMGAMIYVLGDRETVGKVSLGLQSRPGGGGDFPLRKFGYESFCLHDEPMVAYADCEYDVPLNPSRDKEEMLDTLLTYIRQTIAELFKDNGVDEAKARENAQRIVFDLETCHREAKVSFHIKIQSVVLKDMKAQQAFWAKVQSFIEADQLTEDPKALLLDINAWNGDDVIKKSFIDPKVYDKEQGQLFRLLGASKNDGTGEMNYLVPKGKAVADITLDLWMRSLVLRPGAKGGAKLPASWYELAASSSSSSSSAKKKGAQTKKRNRKESSSFKFNPLDDIETGAFLKNISQFCEYLDSNWKVPSSLMKLQQKSKYVWWVTLNATYCPQKGGDHNTKATMMTLIHRNAYEWKYKIKCHSDNHPTVDRINMKGTIPSQFTSSISNKNIII
jgi:hypothetical protein